MNLSKRVFLIAGLYGLVVLLPLYFLEEQTGRDNPPPITHPEFYYGFIGVAVAWQLAFLVIARDPVRFRPLMIPAMVEKGSFGFAAAVLFALGRLRVAMLTAGMIDLLLGTLFVIAYLNTPAAPRSDGT